jgi:hypothetical protein
MLLPPTHPLLAPEMAGAAHVQAADVCEQSDSAPVQSGGGANEEAVYAL